MKFLTGVLSEDTIKELNQKLGDDLLKQVDEKLGDFKVDIGKEKLIPKAVFDADKEKLKKQVSDRDEQLKKLLKEAEDNAGLQAKIKEMQTANDAAKAEYEKSLKSVREDFAYERALAGYKPKNVKALGALIDRSKLTFEGEDTLEVKGLKEQVEALKKSDAYLFEGTNPGVSTPQNPPVGDDAAKLAADAKLRECFGIKTEAK